MNFAGKYSLVGDTIISLEVKDNGFTQDLQIWYFLA